MTKAQRGLKTYRSREVLAGVMTALVAVAMTPIVRAFKVGTPGSHDIHESITGNAITAVMPQADQMFVNNVKSGNYNTDFSHHIAAEFHFDNSTAGNGNGGFTNGFRTVYDMLSRAVIEATVCDANGACNINPLFLNPQHSRFSDLVADIEDTYTSLGQNDGCWNEPACPSTDFSLSSAAMEAEMLPALLVTSDPDPDPVAKSFFPPLNIEVENFGDTIADGKNQLDALLGSHCRPWWAVNQMCFDNLELMAPNDANFQKLASHLRILQYEYQAYYAWQHLGHAFHTTQDFFAHSNYVELAAGRMGPPCDPTSYQAKTICGAPLDTNSGRWDAIRLPTDDLQSQLPAVNVAGFATTFWNVNATLNSLPSIFGDDNFNHLQTGYYPCGVDVDPVGNTGGAAPYDLGFVYCHSATPSGNSSAGMNKDKLYEQADESAVLGSEHGQINRQNFDWAAISAQRTSVVLFESFLFSLPAGSSYISAASARAASQRQGEMAWLAPHRIGPASVAGGILTGGAHMTNLNAQNVVQNVQPQLSATVCPSLDGKSCISNTVVALNPPWNLVTVTSSGAPVGSANITTGQQSLATTNASGIAAITRICYAPGSQVANVGQTTAVRTPIPCGQRTATVSMSGYEPFSFTLP